MLWFLRFGWAWWTSCVLAFCLLTFHISFCFRYLTFCLPYTSCQLRSGFLLSTVPWQLRFGFGPSSCHASYHLACASCDLAFFAFDASCDVVFHNLNPKPDKMRLMPATCWLQKLSDRTDYDAITIISWTGLHATFNLHSCTQALSESQRNNSHLV